MYPTFCKFFVVSHTHAYMCLCFIDCYLNEEMGHGSKVVMLSNSHEGMAYKLMPFWMIQIIHFNIHSLNIMYKESHNLEIFNPFIKCCICSIVYKVLML